MLSILGGHWGGRKLKALERKGLRPTLGRVKAAIFSILESLQWKRSGSPDFSHWKCLDLYAGVGGLGLEVLSRGADHCIFVEKDREHVKVLRENIRSLGCESQTKVLQEEVGKFGWSNLGPFHLILIDPPYETSLLTELLEEIVSRKVLAPEGIILFEHDPKVQFPEVSGLKIHSHRQLGPAGITVFLRNY